MAKEIINQIECGYCHKNFEVATEDLEWEHITDVGEREDNPDLHDYAISQKVTCPHCGKANDVLYKSIGRSSTDIDSHEVMSMEKSVLLSQRYRIMSNFKMKCPNCGAYLRINETGEIAPGNRMREEATCPVCHHEVYSALTSGFVKAYEITEEEFNSPNNYWD